MEKKVNKNVVKGKASEAKVMEHLRKHGPSRLKDIGLACGASPGQEKSWAFSVCKRLYSVGAITKQKKGMAVFYDLQVRDGGAA